MEDEALITHHRAGFGAGYTPIVRAGETPFDCGVDFGIHVLAAGETLAQCDAKECVWVLLRGRTRLGFEAREVTVGRSSLFDEPPTVLHLGPGAAFRIEVLDGGAEWAVARAVNPRGFASRLFLPGEIAPEYRGEGLAQGTCLRNVRLVFDRRNRPDSNLVVGEVVNYPGRWSSYPPHHHVQPEIYHYRFTLPQGYGHAELGERVYKVKQHDTLRIPAGHDHAQVSAPGYGMYYLWIVRHLDGNPYTGFEYSPEHTWLLDPAAQGWEPKP